MDLGSPTDKHRPLAATQQTRCSRYIEPALGGKDCYNLRQTNERTARTLATNTSKDNAKLIRLFQGRGYQIAVRTEEMVQLRRDVATGAAIGAAKT